MENQNQNPIQEQVQNPYPNQNYTAPVNNAVVTIGDWLITMLLSAIPLVNIIMIFVWAFGSNTPISKANWAKATLIFMLIATVLSVVVMVVFAATLLPFLSGIDL